LKLDNISPHEPEGPVELQAALGVINDLRPLKAAARIYECVGLDRFAVEFAAQCWSGGLHDPGSLEFFANLEQLH
jgi:hypothetical protein